jgi:hypothetical protein
MTGPIPDVPRRPQSTGRKATQPDSAAAWRVAWGLLSDGEPHPRTEVVTAMLGADNPISWRTAREILIQAVKDGTLEVVGRDRYTRPILKRST